MVGAQIWEMRKEGCDRLEIIQELAISVQQFEDCLLAFESRLPVDAARVMKDCFHRDNERIEELIECWMPIALGDGTPADEMSEDAYDLQLKASFAVLGAIDARQKIFMAARPEKTSVRDRSVDVLAWL